MIIKLLFNRRLSAWAIGFIVIVVTIVSSNLHWGGTKNWQGIVEADARGYYAYLPAVFIYHDLNFGFVDSLEKVKYQGVHYYEYRTGSPSGGTINKYYAGTAFVQIPFFLIGHMLAPTLGFDADGYSKIYCVMVNIAAIFYLFIGLLFLNKMLRLYFVSDANRALSLLAVVFGTNLFYYTIGEPGMSHVFSFAIIGLWVWAAKRLVDNFSTRSLLQLAVLSGIVFLIRPVNILVVLSFPFIAGDFNRMVLTLKNVFRSPWLVLSLILFGAVAAIQPLIYKVSTGSWWVYSYGNEGFNFLNPHIIDFLFSYKKGFFVYTPMALFIMLGAVFTLKNDRYSLITYFMFWFILTYVFASWWNWWYGGSFSTRVFTEFLPLLAIPLALLLHKSAGTQRILFVSALVVFVVVCQIQTYEYRYMLIHWEEMDRQRFWDVFLRVDLLF